MIITLFRFACHIACYKWNFFYYLYADNVIQYVKKFVHTTCFRATVTAIPQNINTEYPRSNDTNNAYARCSLVVLVYEVSDDK